VLASEPTIVAHGRDHAVLERFDLADDPAYFSSTLPDDSGYASYRRAIAAAHADVEHPVADPPDIPDDHMREVWRREDANRALAYAGTAGTIRPIHCLEALLFARQHAHKNELTDPSEFAALILRQPTRHALRVYVGRSDAMYPPREVYGTDQLPADLAAGWQLVAHLHNHTIRNLHGAPALGVTVPSTNDVQFLRGLAADAHLPAAWVTNGVYTIEIPAPAFGRYQTAPPPAP
jgi:hypothetical protein